MGEAAVAEWSSAQPWLMSAMSRVSRHFADPIHHCLGVTKPNIFILYLYCKTKPLKPWAQNCIQFFPMCCTEVPFSSLVSWRLFPFIFSGFKGEEQQLHKSSMVLALGGSPRRQICQFHSEIKAFYRAGAVIVQALQTLFHSTEYTFLI